MGCGCNDLTNKNSISPDPYINKRVRLTNETEGRISIKVEGDRPKYGMIVEGKEVYFYLRDIKKILPSEK